MECMCMVWNVCENGMYVGMGMHAKGMYVNGMYVYGMECM